MDNLLIPATMISILTLIYCINVNTRIRKLEDTVSALILQWKNQDIEGQEKRGVFVYEHCSIGNHLVNKDDIMVDGNGNKFHLDYNSRTIHYMLDGE